MDYQLVKCRHVLYSKKMPHFLVFTGVQTFSKMDNLLNYSVEVRETLGNMFFGIFCCLFQLTRTKIRCKTKRELTCVAASPYFEVTMIIQARNELSRGVADNSPSN